MSKETNVEVSIPTRLVNLKHVIDAPSEFDVLCGSKSTAFNNHPGNHLFRQKVQSCLAAYTDARTKQQKMKINRQIVQFMRQKFGSRFLKKYNDGTWGIAEEQSIRDKVSHALRYAMIQKEKEERQKQRQAAAAKATVEEEDPLLLMSLDDHFDYEPVPYRPTAASVSSPDDFPTLIAEGDSPSAALIDEVHRRQLSILGSLLSDKVRRELNLFDVDSFPNYE